jgi:hypothetical protein
MAHTASTVRQAALLAVLTDVTRLADSVHVHLAGQETGVMKVCLRVIYVKYLATYIPQDLTIIKVKYTYRLYI